MKPGCTVVHRSTGQHGTVLAALTPHEDAVPHLNRVWDERPDLHHASVFVLRTASSLRRTMPMLLVATETSGAGQPFHERPWLWYTPASLWMTPTEREPRRYVWRDTGAGHQLWDNVHECWCTERRADGGVDVPAWLREEIERRLEIDPPEEPSALP